MGIQIMNNFIKIILLNFLFSSVTFAECKGNCKDGFGSYDWGNQGIYEGNWKNGVFNGEGMFDWRNGEKYVGNFNNGNMHGKGTMTYSTGNKYEGNWKNNTKDGNGTQYFHNGDKYVGQWKNNQMEGNGTYTQSNGNIYHSGLWKNSKPYEPSLSLEELAEKSNKKLEQALNCYRYIDNPNSKKLMRGHIDLLTKMEENMRLYPDSIAGPSEETYGTMIATSNTIIEIGGCRF